MELIAQTRERLGKKAAQLRKERKIPAVIFGKGIDSAVIEVDEVAFGKVFAEAGETSVVDVVVGKEKTPALIKEMQFDPVRGNPIHIGFYKVDLTKKVTANVPVEVVGEEENGMVKSGEAIIIAVLSEIEVEALPNDLPHAFEVNIAELSEIGTGITVGELKYDREKVTVEGVEPDEFVVKLDYAQTEGEEEEGEVSEAEAMAGVEATEELTEEERKAREEEKKTAGGEAGKEGGGKGGKEQQKAEREQKS